MAELKTQKNAASAADFIASIPDVAKRADSEALLTLMKEITGDEPAMWGGSIVGFGAYSYTYASGRGGEWFQVGFSPRKQNLTLYIMAGFDPHDALLSRLGKHKIGKSCLYINKLADVDRGVLRELVSRSVEHIRATNP